MIERTLSELWYRRREPLLWKLALLPLWLLSLVFRLAVTFRRVAYAAGWARARVLPARVISVGNLTAGGAGKTPVVIFLAQRLREQGKRVAVISRGYRGTGAGAATVVSDGEKTLVGAAVAGDEPVLIARSCPGVPVLVGPDRASVGALAVERFKVDTLLLDDGFQHWRLRRDLDVVVVDASNPFGNGHLVPRGPLREPTSALRRAGLVWLSKVDQAPAGGAELRRLEQAAVAATGSAPVHSVYRVVDIASADLSRSLGPEALRGKRVLLLAGLARPASFRMTLASAGAAVADEVLFADHHPFSAQDVVAVMGRALAAGLDGIAVTEKDAVRLPFLATGSVPIFVVRIAVEIVGGEESLMCKLHPVPGPGR